jgi:hypothetical protein
VPEASLGCTPSRCCPRGGHTGAHWRRLQEGAAGAAGQGHRCRLGWMLDTLCREATSVYVTGWWRVHRAVTMDGSSSIPHVHQATVGRMQHVTPLLAYTIRSTLQQKP